MVKKCLTQRLNAASNKYVLRFRLKSLVESIARSEIGNLFHNFGPRTDKARSPYDLSLACLYSSVGAEEFFVNLLQVLMSNK